MSESSEPPIWTSSDFISSREVKDIVVSELGALVAEGTEVHSLETLS